MPNVSKLRINGIEYDLSGSGGGGTSNYNDLSNKPQINGNTLNGNKTSSQLGLASASDIPDELADLQDDATHRTVTDTEKALWNGKADTSDIPTKTSDLTNDSGFITGLTILTYNSSTWNDFITAFNANKIVYCRVPTGNDARYAFLAYYNGPEPSAEFQYYRSVRTHSQSAQGDEVYIYKLMGDGTWSTTTRKTYSNVNVSNGIKNSYYDYQLHLSIDSAYASFTNYYTKTDVDNLISAITTVSFEIVQTLPSTGEANVIYLVPKATAQTQNIYDEYIYTNNAWEKIGDTEIDLSGYYSTGDTAETNLADGDYVPFYDTSATAKRKTLWSNIKAKLKDYFDGIYATISSLATVATSGSYNDLSNKPYLPSMPTDSGVDCNNCKDTGFYHFSSNGPYNGSWGSLIVVDQNGTTSGGTITQIAQCCGPTVYIDVICIRRFYNNAWTSWVKLPMTSDIPTNTNQLTNGAGFITSSGSCAYATNAGKVNNHTVATDVPANAVFTDTNTWRPVVDNLTSTDTDKSLTANQGKVLKGYVDDLYDNLDTKVNKIEPTSSRDFLHTLESGDTFRVLFAGSEIFKVTHTDVYLNGQSFSTYSNTISGQISTLSGKYTNLYTNKQDKLVSGTNIKTVNGTSLLGSGNVTVQETLVSGTNIKTINNQSILGSGNITISAGGTSWGNITGTLSNQSDLQTILDGKVNLVDDGIKFREYYPETGGESYTKVDKFGVEVYYSKPTQDIYVKMRYREDGILYYPDATDYASYIEYGKPTVLWTNPSPTASFASQTVTLSRGWENFRWIEITARRRSGSYNGWMTMGITPTNIVRSGTEEYATLKLIDSTTYYARRVTFVTNGIHFNDCSKFTIGSSTGSTQNGYIIPYQIIGIL